MRADLSLTFNSNKLTQVFLKVHYGDYRYHLEVSLLIDKMINFCSCFCPATLSLSWLIFISDKGAGAEPVLVMAGSWKATEDSGAEVFGLVTMEILHATIVSTSTTRFHLA